MRPADRAPFVIVLLVLLLAALSASCHARGRSARNAHEGGGSTLEVVKRGDAEGRHKLRYRATSAPWWIRVVSRVKVGTATLETRSLVRVECLPRSGTELGYTVEVVRAFEHRGTWRELTTLPKQSREMDATGGWKGHRDLTPNADPAHVVAPPLPWPLLLPAGSVGKGEILDGTLETYSADLQRVGARQARFEFLEVSATTARIKMKDEEALAPTPRGEARTSKRTGVVELDVEHWFRKASWSFTIEVTGDPASTIRADLDLDVVDAEIALVP